MAARRKRTPEPTVGKWEPDPAIEAPKPKAASAPPAAIILRCTQTHGLATDIETTMAVLKSEGVEVPNYTVRVTIVS